MFQDLYKQRKNALEFILVPYWRVLKLSFTSVSPSVCLSPLKFYTLFFSLCFWRIIWNSLNSFKMSNNRSGLYFCCVWSTYYQESNFFYILFFKYRVRCVLNKRYPYVFSNNIVTCIVTFIISNKQSSVK